MKEKPLLIIGAGSIGERHITVLQKLGYLNLFVYRQRNLPLRNVNSNTIKVITDFNDVHNIKPIAAFICTPTSQHISQAITCSELGIHCLIEKPLSYSLDNFENFQNTVATRKVYVQIAYMLRFHPLMKLVKRHIESKLYGNLLTIQSYWGEYLPDWHPWEDYSTSYAAQKALGGGVALTLSHDIDLILWMANSTIDRQYIIKNHRSNLDVNVESGADIGLQFSNGITAHCHLNFFEKSPYRRYRFVFDDASFELDYFSNKLAIHTKEGIEYIEDKFERNQMFEAQTIKFFKKLHDFTIEESISNLNISKTIINICTNE